MANSSTTPVVDSSTTSGSPVPLQYGYCWGTGKRLAYYMLQNTGNSDLDYTRVGLWALGEGEMDGCEELWINDTLTWQSEWDDPSEFHFHRGSDAPLTASLTPSSSGPDQNVDSFLSYFPSGVQPFCYSRLAYYAIFRKQPIQNQTNTHQNDPTQWTDINPIGLWRGLRVRLFDDEGNQTAYAFSTNPAWHFVDAILRRKIFPEYNIDLNAGIDEISSAAQNRFDWGSIYQAAQYFDQALGNGMPRFMGNYAFASQATLAAILEQILKCCRSFQFEYAGKIGLQCDGLRPSVFTVSRQHIMAGSLAPSDKNVNTAGNSYVAQFRDLLVPACSEISGITFAGPGQDPVVGTVDPNPMNVNDIVVIGGTNTLYDRQWTVSAVPTPDSYGNVYSFSIKNQGNNFPASIGEGGFVGLTYSRFKERAPTFNHETNQLARGMVGLGLPRQLNAVLTTMDFAVSTFDQASRLARYERDRSLGLDQSPYVTPPNLTVTIPLFSADAAGSGAAAIQIQDGDVITIDEYASYAYQGDYEVLEHTIRPVTAQESSSGNTIDLTADSSGGTLELSLGPYNPNVFYDSTDPESATWQNVPGSLPGEAYAFASVPLADGGNFVFFTGTVPSGSAFQLPSSGYPTSNLLAWASPAGSNVSYHSADVVGECIIDSNRVCTLQYVADDGYIWGGDVNFAALTWIGSDTTTTAGAMTWLELTLLGGEQIAFGVGVLAEGTTVALPSGFTAAQAIGRAYIHDMEDAGYIMYLCGAWCDPDLQVHCRAQDHAGNITYGNAAVFIFAWKNNMGTVTSATAGNATWVSFPLSNGETFVIGGATEVEDGTALGLLANAGDGFGLEAMVGPSDSFYTSSGGHAQGVGSCYLDASNVVHCTFNDGSGHTWQGHADVLAAYVVPPSTPPPASGVSVIVSPANMSIAASGTLQFSAYVGGSTNTSVTWSVDGVAGGNSTVGTIDSTGLYTAPSTAGQHTVTATSVADSTVSGSQLVSVGGGGGTTGGGSVISMVIVPAIANGACQFNAFVTGTTSTAVTWAVDGIVGGNATVGTISSDGYYTPGTAYGAGVTATLVSNPGIIASAIVEITP